MTTDGWHLQEGRTLPQGLLTRPAPEEDVGAMSTPVCEPSSVDEPAVIAVRSLVKEFHVRGNVVRALDGVDFRLARGERVAIVGRSGSGKTTLLRCLNLLESPSKGEIRFEGKTLWCRTEERVVLPSHADLRRHRERCGMVFQRFELFPHLTALANVSLGPRRVLHMPRKEAEEWAMHQLEIVGLVDRAKARPHELSGGQQQRVAIARSLALQPKVMLFDEPTSALDPELVDEVMSVMIDLASSGMTMAIVTHEVTLARDVASRILVFDNARIIEEGPAREVVEHPRSARTASLLRRLRLT